MKRGLFKYLALVAILVVAMMSAAQSTGKQAKGPIDELRSSVPRTQAKIVVTVDWDKTLRTVDPMSYGVNCPACFDPAWTHSPVLLRPLTSVTAGARPLIRLHGWGMVAQGSNESWLNPDNTWNADKVKSALTPLVQSGYRLMIDIPSGPRGEKDPVDPVAMAPFVAALVKIVNVDNKFGVKYWELPNEREHILSASQMAQLLSNASRAMKKVDPGILVGGPAVEDINVDYINEVVKQCYLDIDFISAHTYGGDGKQSTQVSFESAIAAIGKVHALREHLNTAAQGKYLPIFVDEYNIGWDGNPGIYNNEGAVYFSIIQAGVIDAGGDVSAVWDFSPPHDMSIVNRDGTLTDSANLFSLMNRYFYGDEATASSSIPDVVHVFAVKSASAHSILLSNLSESEVVVLPRFAGQKPQRLDKYEISPSGYLATKGIRWTPFETNGFTLAARSVAILVFQ
jgi:hypothetical protein